MTKFLAIVDPWDKPKPYDSEEFPFLASDIDAQCKLIYNQFILGLFFKAWPKIQTNISNFLNVR